MKHILVQVDEVPRVFPDTRKVRANVAAPKAGASPSREIDALFPRLSSARHAYGQASLVPILTGRQGELASAKELETLRAAQGKMELLLRELNTLAEDLAGRRAKIARAAFVADSSPENLQALKDSPPLGRDEQERKSREVMTAIKVAMKRTSEELQPLVVKVRDRAASFVGAEIEAVVADEEKTAARYSVPSAPGGTVAALCNLRWRLLDNPVCLRSMPRELLDGVLTI